MLISIVVPVYNEDEVIDKFHNLLFTELKKAKKYEYEILYVNDGSCDSTLEKLSDIASGNKNVKIINLSRNFGKELAVTAGINYACGDAVIIMDGDGQHPPEMIPKLISKWESGAQVVVGIRELNQKEGVIKKWGSKLFYRLFNATSGVALVPRSTDFRLIDRIVKNEFVKCFERNRITRGLIDWLGFRREYVSFKSPARMGGQASYKTSQLFKLAMNSFISLSLKPLFLFGWVGLAITVLSFIVGVFIIIEQYVAGDPLELNFSGPAMLSIFVAFMVGLLLISQAITAIYISHIHAQTQDRPLFVIDPYGSVGLDKQ